MNHEIRESDVKLLRQLHPLALERFCQRVLGEVEHVVADSTNNYHQRYLDIYTLIRDSDEELGHIFDHPRRSDAIFELAAIKVNELLTDEEFSEFSLETREAVQTLLKKFQQH